MKGRTLADQKKMKMGGVTKMNIGGGTGGSKLSKFGSAINANKAARNAPPPPVPKKVAPVPPRRGSVMAPVAGKPRTLAAAPVSAMPLPGMKMGGKTYRKGGRAC